MLVFLMVLPCASWYPRDWGSLVVEACYNSVIRYETLYGHVPSSVIVEQVAPISAWIYTFFVVWADMVILGLVIYAVNITSKKNWLGVACAVFLVLLAPVFLATLHDGNRFLLMFSPVNWSSIECLQQYYGKGNVTLLSVGTGCIIYILLLLIWIENKTKKMEIISHTGE